MDLFARLLNDWVGITSLLTVVGVIGHDRVLHCLLLEALRAS